MVQVIRLQDVLPIFASTLKPVVPKFVPHTRATGGAPEEVRVTDYMAGAVYEKDSVCTPVCSETTTEDVSPSEKTGAILQTKSLTRESQLFMMKS